MPSRYLVPTGVVVLLTTTLVLALYALPSAPGPVTTGLPSNFTANGRVFPIKFTASTEVQREHGLMNTKITNATFMLFAWPTAGNYSFYMLDTNTSLDMIWVNAVGGTGQVVYLVTGAQPCYTASACTIYTPTSPANYVLEARAGFAQSNGIVVGSIIRFG